MLHPAGLSVCLMVTLRVSAIDASAGDEPRSTPRSPRLSKPVALAFGIDTLADAPLTANEREIRIWINPRMLAEKEMPRIRVSPSGRVQGEAFFFSRADGTTGKSGSAHAASAEATWRRCAAFDAHAGLSVCTATFSRTPDWRAIYAGLVRLDLWRMPDEMALASPDLEVSDGTGMIVELRDGEHYCVYGYNNPQFRSEAESIKASGILHKFGRLFRSANS